MYYKITDKSCEAYRRLRAIRENEIRMERANRQKVEALLGFPITRFLGRGQQETFTRTTQYSGFAFPENVIPDTKLWRPSSAAKDIYTPNRRTKAGRDLAKSLSSLEESVSMWDIWDIVGVTKLHGRLSFPFILLCGDIVLLELDEQQEPIADGVVEITRSEFKEIATKYPEMR